MPVSYIPSAEQLINRQKTTAKKRRRNQNVEIDELALLLPVKQIPLTPQSLGEVMEFDGLGGSVDRSKSQPVDKISVLRIVSTFLRFQEFVKKGILPQSEERRGSDAALEVVSDMITEAMDGFLLVLDKDGTILFVSESITAYIGLTQNDVIGLNLEEITHPDDRDIIHDNLVAKNVLPPGIINKGEDTQPRQFYIRLKSTMSPGRIQLSRFSSYTRIQITGSLKVTASKEAHLDLESKMEEEDEDEVVEYGPGPSGMEAVGFVGECRLIESTSSILEITMPQPHFTTTISLNMKIVAVESQVQEITGFTSDNFIGTRLMDYFHPADYLKLIPCEVMLMHTGHAVSPVFRFMSSNGGWIWMQMEGMLRYKPGTKQRQFWEVKSKIISQEEGQLAMIVQKELYTTNADPNQDFLNPHKDRDFLARLADAANLCGDSEAQEPIVRKLKEANLSQSAINGYLEGRERGLFKLPDEIKTVLQPKEVPAFKDGSLIKNLEKRARLFSSALPSGDTPPGIQSPPQSGTTSPTLTYISTLSSVSDTPPSTTSATSELVNPMPSAPPITSPTEALSAQAPPTNAVIPTAHVRPIPRQTHVQQQVQQSLDPLKPNLETVQSKTSDTGFSSPSDSAPLKYSSLNQSLDTVFEPSPADLSQPQQANNFSTSPAGMAITNLFGSPSTDQVPTFTATAATFQGFQSGGQNQKFSPFGVSAPYHNVDEITPTLDFGSIPGFGGQNQNGDQALDDLLKEVNELGYGMGVASNNGHTHTPASVTSAGGNVAMYPDNSIGLNGSKDSSRPPANGANSDLLEILSQFS